MSLAHKAIVGDVTAYQRKDLKNGKCEDKGMKVIGPKLVVSYVKLQKNGYFADEKTKICFLKGKRIFYFRLFCVDLPSFELVYDDKS